MTDKIAVIFPGIGYGFDRPLLHFAAEQAMQFGFEVKKVAYGGFPKKIRGDEARMKESFDIALSQTDEILGDVDWNRYRRIVFISKSVGTIAAAYYADRHHIPADQIFFTPFPQTFGCPASGRSIAFHARTDPWMNDEDVIRAAKKAGVRMTVFDEGNHSLETGDAVKDIGVLLGIFEKTEAFFI